MTLPKLLWRPSPNFADRRPRVRLIVAHSCEGSYGGSVAWFGNKASGVSAHFVVKEDGTEITQCVSLDKVAWHVRSVNDEAIGCELSGWAVKGFSDAEWRAEARLIAYLLHLYGLPVQWARKGQGAGFCRHFDLRGIGGNSHVDPCTDDLTWLKFVAQVQEAFAAGDWPTGWAHGEPAMPSTTAALVLPASAPATAQSTPSVVQSTRGDIQSTPAIRSTADLQVALNRLGAQPALNVDGQFGFLTSNALRLFQASHNLVATGETSPVTIAALERALGKAA